MWIVGVLLHPFPVAAAVFSDLCKETERKIQMIDYEQNKRDIADHIHRIRKQKGIAVKKLALIADISEQALSDILKGKSDMKVNTLISICTALEVFPGEILPQPSWEDKWEMQFESIRHSLKSVQGDSRETAFKMVLAVLSNHLSMHLSSCSDDSNCTEELKEVQMNNFEENVQYIAKQIERIREERDGPIEKLAEKAGISESALSNILNGGTNMRVSTLIGICEAFKVFPEEILPQPTYQVMRQKRFESIRHRLASIPDGAREIAIKYVEGILGVLNDSQ